MEAEAMPFPREDDAAGYEQKARVSWLRLAHREVN